MKKTDDAMQAATALLDKAKHEIYENMEARGFAAVIWDLSNAGFHYIPEIFIRPATGKGKTDVVRIAGLYAYDGTLYAIEEDNPAVDFNKFYNPDDEVRPVVVTLTTDSAASRLGDPRQGAGFTTKGSVEEWIAIGDCYFEALAEE